MSPSKLISYILIILIPSIFISCGDDDNDPVTEEAPLTGTIEWLKTIGGSGEDSGSKIIATTDGGYMLVGTTNSFDGDITDKTTSDNDIWVVKLTNDGSIVWSRTYGSTLSDKGYSIIAANDGNYVISGYVSGGDKDVSEFAGSRDFWIFKINPSGDIIWENSFGYAGNDQAFDVFQTEDNGYFVSGIIDVSASNGQGNTGNPRTANAHAGGDYWVMKLDPAGELMWSRYYGGTFTDNAYQAVETANGDFIIVGFSDSEDVDISNNKGAYDYWVVRISQGDILWQKNYGGSEIDIPYAISKTLDGNYIIVGDTRSADQDITNAIGNADVWAITINGNGDMLQQKSFGGTQFDTARSVATLSNGNYVVTATTRSNDGDATANNGQNDIWTILLNENLELIFEKSIGGSNFDFGEYSIESNDNKIITIGSTESNDGDIENNVGIKDLLITKIK